MTENTDRGTAKIYQFPVGGRSGPSGLRETFKPVADVMPETASKVAIGGSWYHEEAILEADNSRKH